MERVIDAEGVESALATLDELALALPDGVCSPGLLDPLAGRLHRSDREAEGQVLIVANHEWFPGAYVPLESLVFILNEAGRREEAFALSNGSPRAPSATGPANC